MPTYVSGKVHGIRVTGKALDYDGSVTVDRLLLKAAGIDPYERVDVISLTTGARWTTYAMPGDPGEFRLNGGGARLGEVGDRCVVIAYRDHDEFPGCDVVHCDPGNDIDHMLRYPLP